MSKQPHQVSSALELGPDLTRVLASVGHALDAIAENTAPARVETAFALMEAIETEQRESRLYRIGTQAAARLLVDGGAAQRMGAD